MGKMICNYSIFALLMLLLAGPVFLLDRYAEVGPELLQDPLFTFTTTGWQVRHHELSQSFKVEDGVLNLTALDANKNLIVSQEFRRDPLWKFLRLQGEVAVQDVAFGEKKWHRARLGLVQSTTGKADYSLDHVVIQLDGTVPWKLYKEDFAIAEKTDVLRVMVQLSHSSGQMLVRGLHLGVVCQKSWWQPLQRVASICLYGFLLYLIYPYFLDKKNVILNCCLGLSVVGIVVAVSISPDVKTTLLDQVESGLATTSATVLAEQARMSLVGGINFEVVGPKVGHFLLFNVLALLLCAAQPYKGLIFILADVVLVALCSEALQLFIDGRGALWGDVLIDCVGGLVGGLLWISYSRFTQGRETLI